NSCSNAFLLQLILVLNPEDSSEGEEDFLSGLSPDEKECLEYLLQTIKTLDEDLLEEDDEVSQEQRTDSLGSEDRSNSSIIPSPQQSQSAEAVTAKPGHHPEASKTETTTSLSEESGGGTQHRPDAYYPKAKGHPQSVDARTAHFRKFDTIMRSGVSVQELRSRFLLHFDSSTALKEPKEAAAAATIWQPGPLPGGQTSPRDEALQKLGLLQGNSSVPNRGSPPVSTTSHQNHISPAESLNRESAPVSFSTTAGPIYAHTMVTVQECDSSAGAEH
ncbi:hypothetical protein lerEdw1_015486, partial [Lerista edwardsae]